MILIVDMNRGKDSLGYDEFVRPLSRLAEDHEVRHYTEVGDPEAFDRIILSGTPLKDNGYLGDTEEFSWVRTCDKPILGICAGMQAIAQAHGGKLKRCQEIGMTDVETVKENPLFEGAFEAYELHNHAVNLTADFEALAKSKNCIQAIKHRTKPIYGVLFHPEVRNNDIIRRFTTTHIR